MQLELVSMESIGRVFRIRVGNDKGTGFILEENNEKYLITARHMFKSINYLNSTNIEIEKKTKDDWDTCNAKVFYHTNTDIDIAVVKTDYFENMIFDKVHYSSERLRMSQNVFMLGFPYGLANRAFVECKEYPLPIVKKGTYSGVLIGNNCFALVIDWSGNEGFSGGPVVYHSYHEGDAFEEEYIAGVIASGHKNNINVYDENQNETKSYVRESTGIEFAYRIEDALEIIKSIK